ncbi:MAG: UDP-N-acetylmuramoyl-L-alanine--D-glutamate ligase [Candidatus Pacebacteria bacterium]|nr:UDP-N-acetylmuramoyl-L-alanine--D-glutamate ligase [Candidatus Paceibacterota bacterium]
MEAGLSNILILGSGLSGCAAAELAVQEGHQVTMLDEADEPACPDRVQSLLAREVEVYLGWNQTTWKDRVDTVIISPGIPPESRLAKVARSLPCPTISELEFGFRHCSCPVLAVTGTNGKSTTVELVTHCLNYIGRPAVSAGNIGVPLCDAVRKSGEADFMSVEVSSFQLERVELFAPLVAALLNLTPDHLDRYPDTEHYFAAKMRLFSNMKRQEKIVLRHDLLESPVVLGALPPGGRPITFAARNAAYANLFMNDDGVLCWRHKGHVTDLLEYSDVRLRGRHNVENILAAMAICWAGGIEPLEVAGAVKTFAPYPHRLELVAVRDGIKCINDSKATNPDALARALEAVGEDRSGRILLIAGGLDKGVTFGDLNPLLRRYVKEVFLIGQCREKLAKCWRDSVPCKMFASMTAAVDAALESACYGDTVLLSPGCASQDMFENYAARGESFTALIKKNLGE